jgi:4-hydroxy-2-oxoheptanedioate aldolase
MVTLPELVAIEGRAPVGTFVKIPSLETMEILKIAGFDFIVIDSEHAPYSLREIDTIIAFSRSIDLAPIVRISDHGYADPQRVLDAGAAGIFVPHVSSGAEAARVIGQMIHPPHGVRGHGGGMRAGSWGMTPEGREAYTRHSDIWRVMMIEEVEAVEAVDDILSVPGLSAIFIGPGDLSMSMNVQPSDPKLQEAVDHVFVKARAAGVPVGTIGGTPERVRALVDQGYDFVLASNDLGLFAGAAQAMIKGVRG